MKNFYKFYKAWLETNSNEQHVTDDSIIYQINHAMLTAGDFKDLLIDCDHCRYKETDSELSPCVVCNMGLPQGALKNQFVLDTSTIS